MISTEGQLVERYLDHGGRLVCPSELVPAPGQYLLAHAANSESALSVPIFLSEFTPGGFRTAPALPAAWRPGTRLSLRGPLGHGFTVPATARHVALVACDADSARLHGLIPDAIRHGASVTLLSRTVPDALPEAVEAQPLSALAETLQWADYLAFDVAREVLPGLLDSLAGKNHSPLQDAAGRRFDAQVLVRAPMPCGALADCGVCALAAGREWVMVCKDGPVFDPMRLR